MKTMISTSAATLARMILVIGTALTVNAAMAQTASIKGDDAVAQLANNWAAPMETSIYTEAKFDRAGEYASVNDFIAKKLVYPENARIIGASGEMIVRLKIMPNGALGVVDINQSPGLEFDKAVLDAINKMPRWTAATRDGKSVASTYELRLNFRLQ